MDKRKKKVFWLFAMTALWLLLWTGVALADDCLRDITRAED